MQTLRTVPRSAQLACVASLGLLGFLAAARADDASAPTVAERIVIRTNAAREGSGLRPLATDPRLTAAAQNLADFMARTGQFSHQADGRTADQRVTAQGYRWTFVGENIAYRSGDDGGSPDGTAKQFVLQWWNSAGHRANILSPQPTQIGVATARAPSGALYAVQVFAAPAPAP